MHPRSIIRNVFIARIRGNTAAEDRVYDSRIYNLDRNSLPGIIVFTENEEIITDTINYPRSQNRILKVNVECYVKASDDVSGKIDDLCLEIEQIILSDGNLGRIVTDCRLESCNITFNNDGEKPVSVASLIFSVNYRSIENALSITIR